jgi:hypothetical protein
MFRRHLLVAFFLVLAAPLAHADTTPKVPAGQRVFSAGHSFHVFMPGVLNDLAAKAGIKDHKFAGLSAIGGSRVIQHWDAKGEKFKAKEALQSGQVDVLTLSPIHLPDEGIENFAKLAIEHNPKIRIFIQENWLPFDIYDTTFKLRPKEVDHNAATGESLRKLHEPYFKGIDAHVRELNEKLGTQALHVAPVGQAIIALREKIIAGEAPGLKVQKDLFTDPIGHARPPLMALVGYVYYSVIYRTSPVGLPVPAVLAKGQNDDTTKLNRLLQELAWQAAVEHPLSGVKAQKTKQDASRGSEGASGRGRGPRPNSGEFGYVSLQAGADAEFSPLFNGKNLDGWKTRAGEPLDGKTEAYKGRFKAIDGKLVIDPSVKGDVVLVTAKEFTGDAHIKFEFRAGEKCNNDLFFRGNKFDITLKLKNLKPDAWNDLDIIAKGDSVIFQVNGQEAKATKNKGVGNALGIRAEFGAIEIRKIRVK